MNGIINAFFVASLVEICSLSIENPLLKSDFKGGGIAITQTKV
jgi:hypothetical protein